jgi:hypothetical protein
MCYSFLVASFAALLLCAGCFHGDAIILRDVQGRVLDQTTGAPIPDARVTATLHVDRHDYPERTGHGSTADNGRFRILVTIGGGSITWVLFIPIWHGDNQAPKVQSVRLVIERNGQADIVERSVDAHGQSSSFAESAVDLGDLTVRLKEK